MMPEKKYTITENDITTFYEGEWYCFPFIILQDQSDFMESVWANWSFRPDGSSLGDSNTDKIKFYQLLDKGNVRLIHEYLTSDVEQAYKGISALINANPGHWESTLITCKLF